MAKAGIYNNGMLAGLLEKINPDTYVFRYTDNYYLDHKMPAISLSFPKRQQQYVANELFPFFYGLLAEGINKEIQCSLLKIDEEDDFTRLMKTASEDTIGAITVREIEDNALYQ